MKMQRKYWENRRIVLLLLVLLIVSNVLSGYFMNRFRKLSYKVGCYSDFIENTATNDNMYAYYPQIQMLYDEKLEQKINDNLKKVFQEWVPEKLYYADFKVCVPEFANDKYFSSVICYEFNSGRRDYVYVYNTIDMRTGEIVYLNDLIEVDDDLISLLLTEGSAKLDFNVVTGEHDGNYPINRSSHMDSTEILEKLEKCSEPYNEENGFDKPAFYIKKNRIYFVNVFNTDSEFYVELNAVKSKLKVSKW